VADESVLFVRPDAPYPKLANANYGTFAHLAEAHEGLDLDPDLSDHVASYTFFSRLYSAQDVARRFGSAVRGLLRDLGQDTPKDLEIWFAEQGAIEEWAKFTSARNPVSDYRLTYVHDIEPIRIDSRIPRPEYIKSYADLSRLALVLADKTILDREFQPIGDIATQLLRDLESACEVLWRFFLAQLDSAGAPDRLSSALAEVTDDDRARLHAILAHQEADKIQQGQTGQQDRGRPNSEATSLSGLSSTHVSRWRGR
jgi:hypothetical protein